MNILSLLYCIIKNNKNDNFKKLRNLGKNDWGDWIKVKLWVSNLFIFNFFENFVLFNECFYLNFMILKVVDFW